MNRIVLGFALTVLMSACGAPSVQDFVDDPELLGDTMTECMTEKAQGQTVTERCRNAQKATEQMGRNLMR